MPSPLLDIFNYCNNFLHADLTSVCLYSITLILVIHLKLSRAHLFFHMPALQKPGILVPMQRLATTVQQWRERWGIGCVIMGRKQQFWNTKEKNGSITIFSFRTRLTSLKCFLTTSEVGEIPSGQRMHRRRQYVSPRSYWQKSVKLGEVFRLTSNCAYAWRS